MARSGLPLTLALERYDRHVPFFDGSVAPEGVALTALDVGQNYGGRHGADRKHRILAGEFDVGELSLGSFVMLRDRGAPFVAIPVFPRRLFSASRWYVNAAVGIDLEIDAATRKLVPSIVVWADFDTLTCNVWGGGTAAIVTSYALCANNDWVDLDTSPLELIAGDRLGARIDAANRLYIFKNGAFVTDYDVKGFPFKDGHVGVSGVAGDNGLSWDDLGGGDWK